MNRVSRRTFLRRASLGAAAVGVATAVPSFVRQRGQSNPEAPSPAQRMGRVTHEGPLLAQIDDVNTGEITVMVGSRAFTYQSPTIARQLLSATQ
ncbi:MAG: twin-arginine translocation signal domain-containing protein [Candidatus Dormibacteria bacterium]